MPIILAYNWPNICFITFASFALITQVIIPAVKGPLSQLNPELSEWLKENDFEKYATYFVKSGYLRLIDLVEINLGPDATLIDKERFQILRSHLQQKFILKHFIVKNKLQHISKGLEENNVSSIHETMNLLDENIEENPSLKGFGELINLLPKDKESLDVFCNELWEEIAYLYSLPSAKRWSFGSYSYLARAVLLIVVVIPLVVAGLLAFGVVAFGSYVVWGMTRCSGGQKPNFLAIFTGNYLYPHSCFITFLWSEPATVGTTLCFVVEFYQRNRRPYPISNADGLLIEITQGVHKIGVVTELGGISPAKANVASCKFTARKAGEYRISVLVGNQHIRGSPFRRVFLPGPPDPSKMTMVRHSSTVVCTAGIRHHILVEARDMYHNLCIFQTGEVEADKYGVEIKQLEGGWSVDCSSRIFYDEITRRINIQITLQRPGCYEAKVTYCNEVIPNGNFEVIALTADEASKVQKTVLRRCHEGYEARLMSADGSSSFFKGKKVYCYISPKQLIIKEFILKLIPMRVSTFRLCPSTKFSFKGFDETTGSPILTIDDGCQPVVSLACLDRNVIAATFVKFMLKNIGGSETFKDKQDHFYHEIRRFHSRRRHDRLLLNISRDKLLESSMKSVRYFTVSDWCKNFEINFIGEEGIDWGGLRREWFELICVALFDPSHGLFASFHEGPQALVYPNPDRPNHLKLKHYEFAGKMVAKCLYESALGGSYRLHVKARFARSFLAQLIGLRVHFQHFSHDDPDLYNGKILHLLRHHPDSLDEPMFFVDEVFQNGRVKVVELEPGGSDQMVTNENKMRYLDALAQFRLCSRVKSEVDAFLSGLNEIIPDNLLCIFDENELELLMCGIDEYSVADFKAHHIVNGSSSEFSRVLYWFWTAVSNFTEEEMARLLQFTTGCSRLPPGGFSQLAPQFQICSSFTYDNLPTAHTCFNMLCLPDYDCYEDFEKALLLAIKEGSEGFGLI